jgi:hypothetical protein
MSDVNPTMLTWPPSRPKLNDAILPITSKYAADREAGIKAIEAAMETDGGFMR